MFWQISVMEPRIKRYAFKGISFIEIQIALHDTGEKKKKKVSLLAKTAANVLSRNYLDTKSFQQLNSTLCLTTTKYSLINL